MIDTNVKGAALRHARRRSGHGRARSRTHRQSRLDRRRNDLPRRRGLLRHQSRGLKSINDGLRQDVLGTPVRVTSIEPGMVETDFSRVRFRGDEDRAAKVYQGRYAALTPEDVADAIVWAASRPAHVNIAHVLMTPVAQANSLLFHRERRETGNTALKQALKPSREPEFPLRYGPGLLPERLCVRIGGALREDEFLLAGSVPAVCARGALYPLAVSGDLGAAGKND
jgi:hypothetical protein